MFDRTVFLVSIVLVLGLIDYTMTRILIQGSIFESFRRFLKVRSAHSAFWRYFNEMFSCHLCLGAEISLWILSLPLHYFSGSPLLFFQKPGLSPHMQTAFTIGSWFLVGMAITAVHYIIWDKTVDKPMPKKETLSPELLEVLASLTPHGRNKKEDKVAIQMGISFSSLEIQSGFDSKKVSLAEFTLLFFFCQYSCANYDCPFARPECIQDIIKRFAEGKLMRVLGLIGTGKIPEDALDRLRDSLFESIDDAIRDLREDNSILLGSVEWYEKVKQIHAKHHIEEIVM